MRWRVSVLLVVVGACYAPRAPSNAPCTPSLANCPGDQICALLDGDHVCVDEAPGLDAATADATIADDADAPVTPDAPATKWMLVRTAGSMGNDVTFGATTAGTTIIVGIETSDTDPVTALTDNANNTYARIPGSRAITNAEDVAIELWYANNALAGATRLDATGVAINAIVMWEVAGLSPTNPLDTNTRLENQNPTQSPAGAAITTTAPGQFVVSIAIVGNSVSGLKAGSAFTNDHLTFGNGWAHLTSNTAPAGTYQATWDQPNSAGYCATSAAFRTAP